MPEFWPEPTSFLAVGGGNSYNISRGATCICLIFDLSLHPFLLREQVTGRCADLS